MMFKEIANAVCISIVSIYIMEKGMGYGEKIRKGEKEKSL